MAVPVSEFIKNAGLWRSTLDLIKNEAGVRPQFSRPFLRFMLENLFPIDPDDRQALGLSDVETIGDAARAILDRNHPGWDTQFVCQRCLTGRLSKLGEPFREFDKATHQMGQLTPASQTYQDFQSWICDECGDKTERRVLPNPTDT